MSPPPTAGVVVDTTPSQRASQRSRAWASVPYQTLLEVTLGYKYVGAEASNGSITFTRVPLDIVASLAGHGHRLGVGPTIHLSPSFGCDGAICGGSELSFPLDTAVGLIAQYAYGYRRGNAGLDFGFRYTHLTYERVGVEPFDGSSFGVFVGGWL